MSDTYGIWTPLISFAISALAAVLARLIDRFLPDPTGGEHPLPPTPAKGRHAKKQEVEQ